MSNGDASWGNPLYLPDDYHDWADSVENNTTKEKSDNTDKHICKWTNPGFGHYLYCKTDKCKYKKSIITGEIIKG